jgi:hypothetical protein
VGESAGKHASTLVLGQATAADTALSWMMDVGPMLRFDRGVMTWRLATSSFVTVLTVLGCGAATGGLGSGDADDDTTDGSDTETSTDSSGNEGSEAEGNSGDGDGDAGDGDGDGDAGDGDGDGNQAMCGNGVVEDGEVCDGTELAGSDCISLGFTGGTLECDEACQFNTKGCTMEFCGNGILEPGEACDGMDIGDADCIALGEGPGTPGCTVECTLDLSTCGLEGEGEACEFWACEGDLYCEDNKCYDGSLGDPCSADEDCLGNNCSDFFDGVCE